MSDKINDGGPAFPNKQSTVYRIKCVCGKFVDFNDINHPGMSLRDYFAGCALIGIWSYPSQDSVMRGVSSVAEAAYQQSDAMIKERGKE